MDREGAGWLKGLAVVVVCLTFITLAGLARYSAQIEAYRGALSVIEGNELGLSGIASGMAGSIGGAMLVGVVIFVCLLLVAWVTLDVRWSLALVAALLVPLGLFNLRVAQYIHAHPALLSQATTLASSYSGQVFSTFSEVGFPVIMAVGLGLFVARYRRDQLEREQFRVPIPSRAERDAAEKRAAAERSAATAQRSVVTFASRPSEHAVPLAGLDPSSISEPGGDSTGAGVPAPAVAPRRVGLAVVCAECGATNPPLCALCARCGASLTA